MIFKNTHQILINLYFSGVDLLKIIKFYLQNMSYPVGFSPLAFTGIFVWSHLFLQENCRASSPSLPPLPKLGREKSDWSACNFILCQLQVHIKHTLDVHSSSKSTKRCIWQLTNCRDQVAILPPRYSCYTLQHLVREVTVEIDARLNELLSN